MRKRLLDRYMLCCIIPMTISAVLMILSNIDPVNLPWFSAGLFELISMLSAGFSIGCLCVCAKEDFENGGAKG